jgi:ABC-type transporter Mla subunit MlaD
MSESDMHLLFQQMGEVLSGIHGLHDTIDIRQAQAEQLHDLVRTDLATLRRDQRDLEEKLDCIVLIAQHDIEKLRAGYTENARSVQMLLSAIEALRTPIQQVLALKARVAGLLFAAGIAGSCALWLAEPVYRWCVDAALQRR